MLRYSAAYRAEALNYLKSVLRLALSRKYCKLTRLDIEGNLCFHSRCPMLTDEPESIVH